MYESIQGTLIDKTPQKAIVEVSGIGYRLAIPLSTYAKLPDFKKGVFLFLSHVVREDSETLYAFLEKEERDLFETLITLSGIGPKTALAIVGHLEVGALQRAIQASDLRILSKIPGVGKKTAERLVIELRDKWKGGKSPSSIAHLSEKGNLFGDALGALLNLGYGLNDSQKAVQQALEENKGATLSELIPLCLQKMN